MCINTCVHVSSLLSVPIPDVVTTPSRTTPLYAGTSVTLTCIMTLHPNVDSGESVTVEWWIPSSLSRNQYSYTGLHTSGKLYTRNITISPLLIRHSGRYVCSVTVTGRNVKQTTSTSTIDITVTSKLSLCMNLFILSLFPYSSSTTTCDHISCQWFPHCWAALLPHLLCGGSTTSCGGPWYSMDQAGW